MNKKLRKIIFELSRDSRITTKELGKNIRSSQQSSSYLKKQLKKKKIIKDFTTVVDPVKLGYTNIIAGYNYLEFDQESKKEVIDFLSSRGCIVSIEEAMEGADLIVEYSSQNLSAFNKVHTEIMQKLRKNIETKFLFPVIVKHYYQRNYLVHKPDYKDKVLCGDRDLIYLNQSQDDVLKALVADPGSTIINISKDTGVSIKAAAKAKKELQKKAIIRGYGCILNYSKLGIKRDIILLKFYSGDIKEIDRFVEYTKQNKNIVEIVKTIGHYNIMVFSECFENSELLRDMRSQFPIREYFMIRGLQIHKKRYLPLDE